MEYVIPPLLPTKQVLVCGWDMLRCGSARPTPRAQAIA